MYAERPTQAQADGLGLTLEELEPVCEVWPDNWQAVMVFRALSTQWRAGMSGRTGLDYSAIPPVLDLQGIRKPKHRREIFEAIQVMESEALSVFFERSANE